MTQLDVDRALALTYVPSARRAAVGALWRLDVALGAVLAGGREPLISQIKLAWWREALEKLDKERPPAEPVLQDVGEHVVPAGVSGSQLAAMEAGWSVLLSQEALTADELATYGAARGALLFRHSGAMLGVPLSGLMERAGEGWALVDLARHSNAEDARSAVDAAGERLAGLADLRWPTPLRPLGMLTALAARDVERGLDQLEPPGSPGRMLRMLRHRLTGR